MLTETQAETFGTTGYGLAEGNEGSLAVFDSATPFDALRTRAPRTLVLRDGDPIARTDPGETTVVRADEPTSYCRL
jgi:cytosine deaminase